MRNAMLLLLPLMLCATPALAQAPAKPPMQIPSELTDPAMADKLADAMQTLSKAFLDLPVGEVQAAMEGRAPVAADKRRTVRSETRVSERELQRRIAESKPMIERSMKAIAVTLPAMMQSLEAAGESIERAAANMPDPTYPKR